MSKEVEASAFIQLLNSDKYNLVASVNTPWQVKGVEAAIRYLSTTEKITPIIILREHGYTGRCVDKFSFSMEFQKCTFIYVKDWDFGERGESILQQLNKVYRVLRNRNSRPLYVLNAGLIDFRWISYLWRLFRKNTKYILLDDGIGGYTGYDSTDPLGNPNSLKGRMYHWCVDVLKKKKLLVDFRILTYGARGLVKNNVAAEYYTKTLKKDLNLLAMKDLDAQFSDAVVINTQCMAENNMVFHNEDTILYEKFSNLLKAYGQKIALKPHPRELNLKKYEAFDWDICRDNTITQEEMFASMTGQPKMVVSIFSSTLVNIQALFGIRTVSLAKLFLKEDLPYETQKAVQDFVNLFSNVMEMPENEEELMRIMDTL